MAKRRNVNHRKSIDRSVVHPPANVEVQKSGPASSSLLRWLVDGRIGLGLAGFLLVWVSYFPADSTAVEQGEALWFSAWAIVLGTIGSLAIAGRLSDAERKQPDKATTETEKNYELPQTILPAQKTNLTSRWVIDGLALVIAGWVMVSAFATSPPGNLRMATNEAWVWIAGAAVLIASRRLFHGRAATGLLLLILVVTIGNSVQGLHQQWISLPADQATYTADPDAVLREIGLDAPEGSAMRMAFENRLNSGGPTGTFALANSLAGTLVVGFLIAFGLLRYRWRGLSWMTRLALMVAVTVILAALVGTHSRSALLVSLIALPAILIWGNRPQQNRGNDSDAPKPIASLRSKRWIIAAALGTVIVCGIGGLAIVSLGDPEWVDAAPASLAFRFQYWRSTASMVIDHPWFGSGPGNFQSIYERYREASANEQIAEPHNFLMESFGAGGLIAGLGVIGLIGAIGIKAMSQLANVVRCREDAPNVLVGSLESKGDESKGDESKGDGLIVLLGGLGALVITWLAGALIWNQLPDLEAQFFAVPIALGLAYCLMPLLRNDQSNLGDLKIGIVAVSALMIHLSVSGGWTVPGVAMLLWCLAGMIAGTSELSWSDRSSLQLEGSLARSTTSDSSTGTIRWNALTGTKVAMGLLALVAIRYISLGPVGSAAQATSLAEYHQREGRLRQANAQLEMAIEADQWSAMAALSHADLAHWELVGNPRTLEISDQQYKKWRQLYELTSDRAGDDPAIHRELLRQRLHIYQRFGQRLDLEAAGRLLNQLILWAPSHQWHWAQLAAVQEAMGNHEKALFSAQEAERLSRLGENYERWLERQLILAVEPIGPSVASKPLREPASSLLVNLLSGNNVNNSDRE